MNRSHQNAVYYGLVRPDSIEQLILGYDTV